MYHSAEIKMARVRKRHVQLTLDEACEPDGKHGGWRPGAGRKKKLGAVAAWFGGWAERMRGDEMWKRELLAMTKPTAAPETWLLARGWKRHGVLRFDERPR